jgi:putative ABC transport system permease protein
MWVTTSASLMIRVAGDPAGVIDACRRAIRTAAPSLPLFDIAPMETALAAPLSGHRFGATLFVVFGVFGLFTAALGTYGVVAFSVSRRLPEFGVRLALGASPSGLLGTVMFEGLRLSAIGIVAGTLASVALSQLLVAVVTEISPRDPGTLAAAGAILLMASAAACVGPALRATHVDPITALRIR